VASAGTYASMHCAPDRQPRQHHTTQFFTGRMPFLLPNQQRQSTEGKKHSMTFHANELTLNQQWISQSLPGINSFQLYDTAISKSHHLLPRWNPEWYRLTQTVQLNRYWSLSAYRIICHLALLWTYKWQRQTSLCSASYVRWQHGTAHIRSPHR